MATVGNRVEIAVPDIDQVMGTYSHIRLYRRAGRDGTPTLLTGSGLPIPLVARTTYYAYFDPNGLATHWYQQSYYNPGSGAESDLSEPFPGRQAPVYDRPTLVRMLAAMLGWFGLPEGEYTFPGPSGTTTAAGAADGSTVVCAAYQSSRLPEDAFRDWYLRLASGGAVGQERPVAALAGATGTFTLARPFSAQVPSGTSFDLFAYRPYQFWADCLFGEHTGGYQDVWTPFQVAVAGPPAAELSTGGTARRFSLPFVIERAVQVMRLRRVLGGDERTAVLALAPEGEVHETPTGVDIYLPAGLGPQQVLLIEGYRQCPRLGNDTDTVPLTASQLRLLLVSAAVQALRYLTSRVDGLVEDRREYLRLLTQYEAERRMRLAEAGQWRSQAGLRPDTLHGIGPEWW